MGLLHFFLNNRNERSKVAQSGKNRPISSPCLRFRSWVSIETREANGVYSGIDDPD
jgi:hypothetical protein